MLLSSRLLLRNLKLTISLSQNSKALLANMAAFYAMYHGPSGLSDIASRVHVHTYFIGSLPLLVPEVNPCC